MTAVFLVAALGAGALTGCGGGGGKKENTETFVEIQAYDRGYGIDGIRAVAEQYMELNEGVTIDITGVTDSTLATDIYAGPSIVTTDMYFYGGDNLFNLVNSGSVTFNGVSYPNYFESLNEVYNAVPEGETMAIKDKMLDSYEEFYNVDSDLDGQPDGNYYCAPWMGGFTGIIYNSKMFENYGWTVPVTTDELFELCEQIVATDAKSTNKNSVGDSIDIAPFSFCLEDSYWEYVYLQWWAQYDGIETFNNFFKGQDINGNYTADIAASQGRLKMLEVLDGVLGTYELVDGQKVKRDNVYCDPTLTTRSYIDTQSTFLNAEGARVNLNGATTSAMMPNGDWLENEMYTNFSDKIESGEVEFKMMKTPVISAITDKLSFKDDADLRELIRWIDGGKAEAEKPGFDFTDDDLKIVEEARGVGSSIGQRYSVYIPSFATAKEAAKDFLIFLYSDEGIRINALNSRGNDMPFTFDWSAVRNELSTFENSKLDVLKSTTTYAFNADNHPMRYRGGVTSFKIYTPVEANFNVSSVMDYIDPQTIFIDNFSEFQRLWKTMVNDAGVL